MSLLEHLIIDPATKEVIGVLMPPAQGKTMLAQEEARKHAQKHSVPLVFVGLEVNHQDILDRVTKACLRYGSE